MNDVRAPNYELALVDYQSGMKYKEIAEKYGVTINTVKSWKTRYKWSKDKKKGVHTKGKKVCTQKGGQPGNKNATGPPGNKNAVKTGEFETLFFDTLEEDEMQLIHTIEPDKERLLLQEIQLLTVRERRMLKRIELIKRSGDIEFLQNIEDALTRVQARKQKAIDSLHRYGYDDSRLELEMMKIELETIKHDNTEQETEDDGFMKAMNGQTAEVWSDEDD